jgi:glc operon protein GlcG
MAQTNAPLGTPPPKYGPPITLQRAKEVMAAAEAEATANGWPMVIAIVDSAGCLVLLQRLDHSNYGAVKMAQRKADAAIRFRRSTKAFEEMLLSGTPGLRMLSMGSELVAIEGGIPLIDREVIVGAIGVSGMLSVQDGQVALAGARVLEG